MNDRLEAIRLCLPYATSTAHTEQLEAVVEVAIDEACARAESALALARETLVLWAAGTLIEQPPASTSQLHRELSVGVE